MQTKCYLSMILRRILLYGKTNGFFFGWNSPLCPIEPPRFIAIKDDPSSGSRTKNTEICKHKLLKVYSEEIF